MLHDPEARNLPWGTQISNITRVSPQKLISPTARIRITRWPMHPKSRGESATCEKIAFGISPCQKRSTSRSRTTRSSGRANRSTSPKSTGQNPDQIPSVFDPAVQETGVLFGQRGVEAALSDFDAQLSSRLDVQRQPQIENNAGLAARRPRSTGLPTLDSGSGPVQARGSTRRSPTRANSRSSTNGTTCRTTSPATCFPRSTPDLCGPNTADRCSPARGTDYTRIAGPLSKSFQPAWARRGHRPDQQRHRHRRLRGGRARPGPRRASRYWDLSLAYHDVSTPSGPTAKNVLNTWRLIESKAKGPQGGSNRRREPGPRQLFRRARPGQESLANLYTIEEQFRRLLGFPVNDGRMIRPCDEPTVAEFIPDWHIALRRRHHASPRNSQAEMEHQERRRCSWPPRRASFARLDLVAGGQINAFGDQLDQPAVRTEPARLECLRLAGWKPVRRAGTSGSRRRSRSACGTPTCRSATTNCSWPRPGPALATQEQDVSHEIPKAFQEPRPRVHRSPERLQSPHVRRRTRGTPTRPNTNCEERSADPLLRAQQSLCDREVSYFQAITQYNQAVTNFYYRTGTILDESNVTVAEDMWDPHAYADALREAWARSHGTPNPLLHTEPPEFVVPPGRPTSAIPPVAPIGVPPLVNQPQSQVGYERPADSNPGATVG